MSFCPNCGTKIEEGSRFCGECGTRIDAVQGAVSTGMTSEQEPLQEKRYESEKADQTVLVRPSQTKKTSQGESRKEASITIKKPNIDVKGYKDKVKKLSRTQMVIIAEVVCLVLIIGIFYAIGSSKSSAQSVAKEYMEAYAGQDWATVYDLTNYPEGTYLQKEKFIEIMENENSVVIDNYDISEASNGYSGSNSLWGKSDSYNTSNILKYFDVQYTVKGQETGTMSLELVKQSEKSMLFFDTWKVASSSMVVDNFYIAIPKGATATIDGILLEEAYKAADQGYGLDEYYVSLFRGTHQIQVAQPWFQLYETEFTVAQDNGFTAYDMQLTEDGELALQAKMQEALERCYQAAVEEKDFSEVSDLFMDGYLESAEESYNYLVEGLNDSEYYKLNEVTFDDFKCEFYINDGRINAEMNYDYDMKYTYSWTSWGSKEKKSEVETADGDAYIGGSFEYDGETYKLTSIDIWSIL